MLRISLALFFILNILASSTIAVDKNTKEERLKIGDQAPKFILKDADNKEYNLEKILGKDKKEPDIIVLIIGDHTTRANGNKWAKELDKIYKGKKEVGLFMIADLRGLPFFVTESMVKWGTKKENLSVTILLDWKGKISEQYKTKKGESNIFIIGNDLKIRYYFLGECTPELIKSLNQEIDKNVKDKRVR